MMRKLRLPTAEDVASLKANSTIIERAVIEKKWNELFPDWKMHGSQTMMLIVLMTYLKSEGFKDSRKNAYVPDPLLFSLGSKMGASTFIRTVKEAYSDLVRVVALNREHMMAYGFDHFSNSIDKPALKDKVVIFDGNLMWHDRRFVDHVRGSMPICYIAFGA